MNIIGLRTKIEQEIANRISSRNFYDVLLSKTLRAKLKHLEDIEEITSFEKYKIAFIGTVGAGKTTAICHLFNLLNEQDKSEIESNIEITEILKTGVGYTTLCEVELLLSESNSKIQIEPYSENELTDILGIFAEFIQNSVSPDKDNPSTPGKQIISPELNRAIRNLINLKEITQESVVNGRKIIKRIDKCKEEYISCGNFESFKNSIVEKAKIKDRVTLEVEYPILFGNEKLWLKKVFDEINSARLSNFSLPKKIYISLSKNIIKESLFDNFESIIDTKGLDANENRKDIDEYIKDKRTICIFTTEYKDAPDTNIRSLLEYHFKDKLANHQTKIVIAVLPQKGQPEAEEGANDREDGICIRRGIIQDILSGSGINEIEDSNIIFYDALRYYRKESNKIIYNENEKSKIEEDRNNVTIDLLTTIENRKEFYKKEFDKLEADVNQILNGKGLSVEEENLIIQTQNKINNFSNLNFHNYKDLTDKFIVYYKSNYAPMTIKAINRRHGFYDLRGIDIFYDAQKISAESILRTVTKDYSENILKIFGDLKDDINNDDIGKLIDEIQTQFHYLYKNFIDKISTSIYTFLHDQKLEENTKISFWEDVIDLKGSGYRERVGATFRDELETINDNLPNTNEYFKSITEGEWKNNVINGVSSYLDK